ncbi:TPM domain-containing protein [Pontixanthobacter gangjinensis]|uniref:TPM domain-containing protein n=1 Tax=Pontixanthobacter gangjinensis TaxID=1028742 RepID=A0A6I4SPJ9_9SPHN|nr:TPM domain-containing protein [Pontixanthobacter gangjinensis]MXO57569.1 hypothetical protein [Pontixanthobacter gangjinensis]
MSAEPAIKAVTPLELTGRVVDAAALIRPEKETELTARLEALENDTLAQVMIVTTPDLDGRDIAGYGQDLGNNWGIGDAERNDGVLIIVAPNERSARLEVGSGMEDLLTFARSAEIVEAMLIHFRDGDYTAGIEAGLTQIETDLRGASPDIMETKLAA